MTDIAQQDAVPAAAERLGQLLKESIGVAENHLRSEVHHVTDPRDGTAGLAVLGANGVALFDPRQFDGYRLNPLYRQGTVQLTQLHSFIDVVNRFKFERSAIFACDDMQKPGLTAVFDYHPDNGSEAGDHHAQAMRHRAEYAFPLSTEWKAWAGQNAKPMGMGEFARFIEDNITDVSADPVESFAESSRNFVSANRGNLATPTKLVEISRGLQVYERAVIKEARNLSSGEAQFTFDSEHTDGDGKPLTLPNMFSITIPVFARSPDAFRLIARFRYRKTGEGLLFWYELWRPDLTFETAFNEAVAKVGAETALPVFVGSPEA